MDADNEPNPEELKKLGAAMRRLEKDRLFVPGTVDEQVLKVVRQQFAPVEQNEETEPAICSEVASFQLGTRKVRGLRRRASLQKWLPLAASIAIAAVMVQFARMGRSTPGDLNRDGVVNVVDAFMLSERLASGEHLPRTWDVNADGRVDAADPNEIMARVVDLERSGS